MISKIRARGYPRLIELYTATALQHSLRPSCDHELVLTKASYDQRVNPVHRNCVEKFTSAPNLRISDFNSISLSPIFSEDDFLFTSNTMRTDSSSNLEESAPSAIAN